MAEIASAYVTLIPSLKGSSGTIAKELGGAGKSGGAAASKGFKGSFMSGVKSLAGPVAGLIGVSAGVSFLKDANDEAREAQKIGALTTSTIKATGGAAKVTAKQVGDLAGAISAKTGIDDETIQSGQNMLLTFKNIRNEAGKGNKIFDQTSQTLVDMSTAMGTEPKQAAIQLGKALNDPVKGVSALSRVGVTFTDQQKKQIKALADTGDVMGAQKIVLKELNSEFGGAAEAQATAGDKMSVAFGNLKEQVGTALLPVIDKFATFATEKVIPAVSEFIQQVQDGTGPGGKLADVVGQIRDALAQVLPKVKSVLGWMKENKETVGTFAGILLAVAAAVKAWAVVQAVLNIALTANPIGLVVVAIAALAAGLVYAWKNSETFRKVVTTVVDAVAGAFTWLWNNVLQPVFSKLVQGIGWIMDKFGDMLDAMSHVPGFGWAKDAADKMHGAADKARELADGIKKIPPHKRIEIEFGVLYKGPGGMKALENIMAHQEGRLTLDGARAAGGPVRSGGTYLVGERGPELFTPRASGAIVPNDRLAAIGATEAAGGVVINVGTVRAHNYEDFVQQMNRRARSAAGGGVRF